MKTLLVDVLINVNCVCKLPRVTVSNTCSIVCLGIIKEI